MRLQPYMDEGNDSSILTEILPFQLKTLIKLIKDETQIT